MDRKSLSQQFDDCAPLGATLPHGQGRNEDEHNAIAYEWLQNTMQTQFVDAYRLVAQKAFKLDASNNPEVVINGGNPYRGYVFMYIEPKIRTDDARIGNFIVDMVARCQEPEIVMGQSEGENPSFIVQFKPASMYRALKDTICEHGLENDKDIRRHVNALYHILGRAGENGYTPASRLN